MQSVDVDVDVLQGETLTLIEYFTNTVSISTTHITCCSLPEVLVQNKGLLPKIWIM